jgi:hypothetical protein
VTNEKIKNQMIFDMVRDLKCTIEDARNYVELNDGKCIFCYCNRDGICKNIKSPNSNKNVSNNDSCEYFLNFYNFD